MMWDEILISYSSDITKHFYIQIMKTKQIIITSKLYINKLEQGAKLLDKLLLCTITTAAKKKPKQKSQGPEKNPKKW